MACAQCLAIRLLTMPKDKFNPEAADRYRLRMICLDWYLLLYKGTEKLGALGPWDSKQANIEADKLVEAGVADWDKMA